MPRVALDVFEELGAVISDGMNPPIRLGQLRIFAWVRLGNEAAFRQAVLDTGGPFTILSKQVWATLDRRGAVAWVAHPPGVGAEFPRTTIAGAPYPLRVGRIEVQVARLDGAELRPLPVIVQCVEDDGPAPLKARPILGLGGGVLHGRQLVVEADAAGIRWSAALVEPGLPVSR